MKGGREVERARRGGGWDAAREDVVAREGKEKGNKHQMAYGSEREETGAGGGLGEREIKEEISESQRDNGRLGGLLGFNEGCSRGAGGAGTSAGARRGRFGLGET